MEQYVALFSGISGIIILAGVILIAVVATIISSKKRTGDVEMLAGEMGLTFIAKDDGSALSKLSSFQVFSRGHAKKIRNILSKTEGDVQILIFDYKYTVGYGKNSHTYNQTVISFELKDLELPCFVLRPENIFHKIGSAFGYQDIDFEISPEFSKHFLLQGDNEPAVTQLFNIDVLSYFEREREKKMCVEGGGNQLIYYKSGKIVKLADIRTELEQAKSVQYLFNKKSSFF